MKVNSLEIRSVVIYDAEQEQAFKPCRFESVFTSHRMNGDKYTRNDDYPSAYIAELLKVSNNQINSSKKRSNCFAIIDHANSDYERVYTLYIPRSMIGEIETETEKRDYQKGCTAVSYNTFIYFKENVVKSHDMLKAFVKTDEEALALTKNYENIKSIEEEIKVRENSVSLFKKEEYKKAKVEALAFLKNKLAEGYKYLVFYKGYSFSNCLKMVGYVEHYEKDDEFKKLEKITEIMNTCTFREHSVSTYEVERMLEKLSIKIKD